MPKNYSIGKKYFLKAINVSVGMWYSVLLKSWILHLKYYTPFYEILGGGCIVF